MLKPEEFIRWLENFVEGRSELNEKQTQEVNQKLNEVFNKVTPELPKRKIPEGKEPDHIFPSSGGELKDCEILETKFSFPAPKTDQCYITITKKPMWGKNSTYSHYKQHNGPNESIELLEKINKDFGLTLSSDKTHIIIDNELQPKHSKVNRLLAIEPNHLISPMDGGIGGLVNVGTGEPRAC